MAEYHILNKCEKYDPEAVRTGNKDLPTQLVISLTLGLGAFFSFCVRFCPITGLIVTDICTVPSNTMARSLRGA
jgi:hypothetical protein